MSYPPFSGGQCEQYKNLRLLFAPLTLFRHGKDCQDLQRNKHYKHIWCIFAGNKQMNLGFKFGQNYLSDENAGQIIQR